MEIITPVPFPLHGYIRWLAVCGDSRSAGAGLNVQAPDYGAGRSLGTGCITPLLNLALGGRAIAVNPGEGFTNDGSSITGLAAQQGYSQGAKGWNSMQGYIRMAIKRKVDCIAFPLGFNDATGVGTSATIRRMIYEVRKALSLGIKYVMLFTIWGPGDKDQGAIDEINAAVLALAAEIGDRCILVDRAAYYSANSATFYLPGETPGVHWSTLGQDTFVADIVAALEPYLMPSETGFPALDTSFTRTAELGLAYSKQDFNGSWGFGAGVTAATRGAGDGIAASGTVTTSASGTVSSGTVTSEWGTSAMTLGLGTGAMAYSNGGWNALNAALTSGSRYGIAFRYKVAGLDAGRSWVELDAQFATDSGGTGAKAWQILYRLHTARFEGQWGLAYIEFNADAAYSHWRPRMSVQQGTQLAHDTGSPGAYSGTVTIASATVIDLTTYAQPTNYP